MTSLTYTGELRGTIEEPVTLDMVESMLRELAAMQAPWLRDATYKLIRNEVRFQMTNEKQARAPCALPCLTPSTAHRAAPRRRLVEADDLHHVRRELQPPGRIRA